MVVNRHFWQRFASLPRGARCRKRVIPVASGSFQDPWRYDAKGCAPDDGSKYWPDPA